MDICDELVIVTNDNHHYLVKNQLKRIGHENYKLLLEPVGRNTAPAITLACLLFDKDDIVLVSASDHVIENIEEYKKCIKRGELLAKQGYIVTFGIVPSSPETGYGYIEAQGEDVLAFKEKPDLETAKKYLESGNYYWNSGMFMFRVGDFFEELKKHSEEVLTKSKEAINYEGNVIHIEKEKMMQIPKISIDYALMEHSDKIKVIPSDIGWSDLGSYESLYNMLDKDEDANVKTGNVISLNSKGNLILGGKRVITAIDIEEMIIVDTQDALLISKKNSSSKVGTLNSQLEKMDPAITIKPKTVNRPWGHYTYVFIAENYKVKNIVVNPKGEMSLHAHAKRSEHWTIADGTATILINGEAITLSQNESVFVPKGTPHKIRNTTDDILLIVETSVGTDLMENDIIRYDDVEE